MVYPDSDYMKLAIGTWSAKRLYTWQRIADVLYRKYDPFVNMNRHEWRETVEDRDLAKSETPDLTDEETHDLAGTNDSTVTGNVNAFNDSSANGVQRDKVTTDQDTSDTGTLTTTHTGSVDYTDTGTVTTTDDYHIEGDSAIRDAQDIIRLETEQRLANDLIDIIIEDFKKRFCLMVY